MINLKIKTNGTVRNLTLPYPGQSIPDIIEKNSVVTVSEVTEPESLKYMESGALYIRQCGLRCRSCFDL